MTRAVEEEEFASPEVAEVFLATGDYEVTFNENRSFELTIGRKTYFFDPYSKQILSQDEINHPDFIQQSRYFNIKEI
jgi:hypothetical protein